MPAGSSAPPWPAVTIAAFGYPATFVANAVSFLAVVVAVMFVRLSRPPGSSGSVLKSVGPDCAAARAEPSCRAATIAIGVVAFLAAPFIALVPAMALRLTHGGPATLPRRPPR